MCVVGEVLHKSVVLRRLALGTVTMYIGNVFFFKQKTAYDMRISDWSSDVCSSDLGASREVRHLYPLLSGWAEACLVGRRRALPPVQDVQGAVFLFRVLDGVEAHLLSIRALEEAAWLARIQIGRAHV